MKNTLIIFCLLLTINLTFAQENSTNILTIFDNDQKNTLLTTNKDGNIIEYQELIPVDFESKRVINEGKFSLNDFNDKSLNSLLLELDKKYKKEFFIIEKTLTDNTKNATKKIFIITTNKNFINQLIKEKIIQEGLANKAINYGDRDIEFFKNYTVSEDFLNATYKITSSTQLQIGNSVIPFIKKPFKTEIDKTLLYSLNILAFNF